jgi:hypothetical protein
VAKVRRPFVAALAVLGLGWLGQGIGLIGGSFMSGDPLWALIGAVTLMAAAILSLSNRQRR